MPRSKFNSGFVRVFLVFGIVVLLVGAVGAGVYLNRDRLGLEELADRIFSDSSNEGSESGEVVSVSRPVVASRPIMANERNYQQWMGRSDVLVLVDYYADWCGPCRKIAPSLSKLAGQHGDKVVVLKVNVDKQGQLASRAGVRSIPDVRLYHNGRQLERKVGGYPFEYYESLVLKHEGKLPAPKANSGSTPSRGSNGSAKGSQEGGSIVPFEKDWTPPGVTPLE